MSFKEWRSYYWFPVMKASSVLREELAEAAAQVLATEGHEKQGYGLTN
jgi:hypothetical protein